MKSYIVKDAVLVEYRGKAAHPLIPKNVNEIGRSAFNNNLCLRKVNISNNVKKIDEWAFYFCENLKNITIPNSITEIGWGAFKFIRQPKPQHNSNGTLRAFKAFNKDWTCMNGFQYEIGKSYHQDGSIFICRNGFHACYNPLSVFNHYAGKLNTLHFAEVELSGEMDNEFDKVTASDIKIVRELTATELAEIYNSMEKE